MRKNHVRALTYLFIAFMILSFAGNLYVGQLLAARGFTGALSAKTTVSIAGTATDFDLDKTVIDFGALFRRQFNTTGPGSPNATGIKITNNGSTNLNFTINFSNELFVGETGSNVTAFAFKCRNNESPCTDITFKDASPFPSKVILNGNVLAFQNNDSFYLDISVSVPDNEPPGQKSATITILSVAS